MANIIVKSKIKEITGEFKVSGDYYEALEEEVKLFIKKSIKRAEANNRKTIQPRDL